MKKLIIASLFLLIGTSITIAQESTSFKKFNYGVSLISEFDFLPITNRANRDYYESNVKPISFINYGMGFNAYFNINKMFFLKFGIESVWCNWKEEITQFKAYIYEPNLYKNSFHSKYFHLEFPISFGYNITNISEDITLYCSLGGKFSLMNYYYRSSKYEFRDGTIETYEKRANVKEFFDYLDFFAFPIFASIGLEKEIKNSSAGVSLFFQSRDVGVVLGISGNHQIGLAFEFKF
ncbi:MAG TPA: hypothetical protein PLG05_02795 [Bacteroidales bacterium]|nr:hypothetical protein [Bacteroidales bacterium]HOR59644.1 hypothetical protein [Bacteroidales bacterium]HPL04084.1 hypothetical protein [Bacteroidales bacterium]